MVWNRKGGEEGGEWGEGRMCHCSFHPLRFPPFFQQLLGISPLLRDLLLGWIDNEIKRSRESHTITPIPIPPIIISTTEQMEGRAKRVQTERTSTRYNPLIFEFLTKRKLKRSIVVMRLIRITKWLPSHTTSLWKRQACLLFI